MSNDHPDQPCLPLRPARLTTVFASSPIYFVTFCTARRQAILANAEVNDAFRTGAQITAVAGAAIGRYVIMPDHIHMFVRVGHDARLGLTVKRLREGITKCLRRTSPGLQVWQSGFFDHLLRSSESYSEKQMYVRQNPVRANLCQTAEDWPFQGEISTIRM